MSSIKAIETVYNGYRFRSRLEARWAVFFDTLGISYEYEKEGYNLDGVRYLPDFWLPEQRYWIEIKGQRPTEAECEKVGYLAKLTKERAYIFFGDIPMPDISLEGDSAYVYAYAKNTEDNIYHDIRHWWCECPDCGTLGIEFDGRADRLKCKQCYFCERLLRDGYWTLYNYLHSDPWKKNTICPTHGKELQRDKCPTHGGNFDKGYNAGSPRLIAAYTAARQARFEHGETPQPLNIKKEATSKPEKVLKKPVSRRVPKVDHKTRAVFQQLVRGDRVRHPMFGDGVIEIESRNGSPVWIRFDGDHPSGWFVVHAKLQRIEQPDKPDFEHGEKGIRP